MYVKGPMVLIEDDEDDQYIIQMALEKLQISAPIRLFSNGQAALDYLTQTPERPFMILCDINMPLMNGLELRQRIVEDEYLRSKSIPFVFLTTAATPTIVEEAYNQTVQGFFKKSNSYAEMQQQLQTIVQYWLDCRHPNNVS